MIYGVVARVLLPVAAVALVGAGMWGYQEHNEKNSILIKAENQYQRAFHDLNYHIDKLHDELGKSIVVNSRRQITPCLTNVWRLAYAAQSDVGQLPLTLMPFNNTEEFLAKVADFSYRVAVRDLAKEPLSQREYKTLQSLYSNAAAIQKQLDHVQTKIIDKKLRWMDVETALASDDKKEDNTIIDGFKTMEKRVQEFPEVDWGPGIQNLDGKRKLRIKGISGTKVSPEEAKRAAFAFIGLKPGEVNVEIDSNGKGEEYSAYSLRFTGSRLKNPLNLEVTKRGGKVIWLLSERDIREQKLTMQQAEASGSRFLRAHGYANMVAAESDVYDGLAVFTFVPEINGVRIYPDAVTVKVALDNGDVTGFHAAEYLFNHKPRSIPKPKVSMQRARQMVNPNVNVSKQRLALIESKNDGKEVLCYEFTGNFQNDQYLIYINALTGDEEEVVKMDTGVK
ncbi:germination protein YpeB [Brevibacillus sp. SYP-B805]|uniref:germination protein YpeB n=1 Tax=Brevibacillus sp. SYP-B805 TaxID=1578199 RepID=UPI0013EB298D|nr:germination protein YpeB [Brevibacillus sp. SYP-B805]